MSDPLRSTLEGFVDHVDWHAMRGWAFDRAANGEPLWLEVQIDNEPPVAFLANMLRQDLIAAGYVPGTFGFELRFPQPLNPLVAHRVDVRDRQTGESLPNAPLALPAALRGSAESRSQFEAAITAEIEAAEHGDGLGDTIGFLLRQVDRLLQGKADGQSGLTALQHFRLRWNDYITGTKAMPPQPDIRPWALVIDTDLPDTAAQLAVIRALQSLGYRVAVISTRNLASTGAVAASLAAADVTVLGLPDYFTVEDVLRRHRGIFRAIVLCSPLLAAAYSVITRQHQPRAKLIAMLKTRDVGPGDEPLVISGALVTEFIVADTEELQQGLAQRLPGRRIELLAEDATDVEIAAWLGGLLPRLQLNVPSL
jgi:hypothetical protein